MDFVFQKIVLPVLASDFILEMNFVNMILAIFHLAHFQFHLASLSHRRLIDLMSIPTVLPKPLA